MWPRHSRNKFGAVRAEHNGILYHSKREARQAAELDLLVRAKEIRSWDRQKKVSLDVNGSHITNYVVDFLVQHNDGTLEYIEVKGLPTPEWILKWKLFKAIYPNLKLSIIH